MEESFSLPNIAGNFVKLLLRRGKVSLRGGGGIPERAGITDSRLRGNDKKARNLTFYEAINGYFIDSPD